MDDATYSLVAKVIEYKNKNIPGLDLIGSLTYSASTAITNFQLITAYVISKSIEWINSKEAEKYTQYLPVNNTTGAINEFTRDPSSGKYTVFGAVNYSKVYLQEKGENIVALYGVRKWDGTCIKRHVTLFWKLPIFSPYGTLMYHNGQIISTTSDQATLEFIMN